MNIPIDLVLVLVPGIEAPEGLSTNVTIILVLVLEETEEPITSTTPDTVPPATVTQLEVKLDEATRHPTPDTLHPTPCYCPVVSSPGTCADLPWPLIALACPST